MNPQMQETHVSWQDYLAVAQRRRWFFIAPFAAAMVIGLLVILFAPRIYSAESLIAVQNETLINPLIQGLAMPTQVGERLNTLREEILSWSNLSRLIEKHQLDTNIPKNDKIAYDKLIERLRQDIKVKMRGGTLIEVTYEGTEQAKVQEMVNSLTDIVIERDTAIQQQEASNAINFIEAELGVYRKKLEDSEKKLREFKEVYMTQMPVATALNDQLKSLELQLSNLLIDNTEEHPRVIEIKRQIEEVRHQRDEEIKRLVEKGVLVNLDEMNKNSEEAKAKTQAAYQQLVQGLESPEVRQNSPAQVAIGSQGTTIQLTDAAASSLTLSPKQQQELTSLTRDYSVNESIYRGLLEKLERAKITGRLGEDKEGGKFSVIERARFPLRPVKPNLVQVLLISLIVGAALGVGLVLLVEYLDQAIQSTEEAAEFLQLPVLGSIPTILTEDDLAAQRKKRTWKFFKNKSKTVLSRLKTHVADPVMTRFDQALLRIGL